MVTVFVEEDVGGGHDHEDDNGEGTNMPDGENSGRFRTPSDGWVEFVGSASHRRNTVLSPGCVKTWRQKVCFHQEWKTIRRGCQLGVS